ncbi:MAG: tetratricopeptide repeat protein, partial [Acidobacteriaceae bacterium]|nr:tetratricopeptide repeat protein [Acidobacteriaceae bacterium]
MKFLVVLCALLLPFPHALIADELQDAVAAFQRGDLAAAETAVRSVLSKQPDDARSLTLLGTILDGEQKYPEAETAYRRAL